MEIDFTALFAAGLKAPFSWPTGLFSAILACFVTAGLIIEETPSQLFKRQLRDIIVTLFSFMIGFFFIFLAAVTTPPLLDQNYFWMKFNLLEICLFSTGGITLFSASWLFFAKRKDSLGQEDDWPVSSFISFILGVTFAFGWLGIYIGEKESILYPLLSEMIEEEALRQRAFYALFYLTGLAISWSILMAGIWWPAKRLSLKSAKILGLLFIIALVGIMFGGIEVF